MKNKRTHHGQSQLRAEFDRFEKKVDTKFDLFEKKVDTKIDLFEKKVDTKFDLFEKKVDTKIEQAVGQIVGAIVKGVPSIEDHKRLEGKVNNIDHKVNELDHKVDNLASDMSDVRRRVIDLEHDTPAQIDFDSLKKRVDRLESAS